MRVPKAVAVADDVDEVLTALADPTRRRVLDAVAARGETTATKLAAELPVSRQAIVKHLAMLERAGLVSGRRQGREMRYAVRPEQLDLTARWPLNEAVELFGRVENLWDEDYQTTAGYASPGRGAFVGARLRL